MEKYGQYRIGVGREIVDVVEQIGAYSRHHMLPVDIGVGHLGYKGLDPRGGSGPALHGDKQGPQIERVRLDRHAAFRPPGPPCRRCELGAGILLRWRARPGAARIILIVIL